VTRRVAVAFDGDSFWLGASHGLAHVALTKDQFNTDLLDFIKA
jgi:hypothetical protein